MLFCVKWFIYGFDFIIFEILKVIISDEIKKNEKEDKRVKEEGVVVV